MDLIGRYKIVGKIGQGGTSHVWKGFDATLNREVAVKTISADAADDPTLKKRFEREAQAAAGLNHPHIVTVFDFGQEGDKLYMAMELLVGVDLKQAISSGRFRDLESKLEAMSQICEGVAFAHANEIVHRDLKPANIHILPDGQIKIMDFGLARVSGSDMTKIGVVMGTPHYMAPEQVRGEKLDFRSDVFALGCVFYEIVTGKKPFDADSIHSVLYKVMQEEPKSVRELVPGLPGVLQQIIEKAMAKAPAQRFAHAGELGEFLERAREAISVGRGDEALPGLVAPVAVGAGPSDARGPSPAPAAAPAAVPSGPSPGRQEGTHHSSLGPRRGERSGPGSGSRPRSQARTPPAPSRALWYGLGATALVLAGVVGFLMLRSSAPSGDPGQDANAAKLNLMMQDVAKKRAELARSRLEAGQYEDALEKAQEALNYDPEQAEAKAVALKAREVLARVEKAIAASKPSGPVTSAGRAAFWDLLQVAPEKKEAGDFASSYDSGMRGEAEQAKGLMATAQKQAEAARAKELDDFKAAGRLADGAEAAFKEGRYATAARDFMRARQRFRRAQGLAGGTS